MTKIERFLKSTEDAFERTGHTADDIESIGNTSRTITLGDWSGFRKALSGQDDWEDDESRSLGMPCGPVYDLAIRFNDHSCLLYNRGYEWLYVPSKESTDREPVPAPPEIVWTNEYGVDLKEKYRRLLEQRAKDEVLKQVSGL